MATDMPNAPVPVHYCNGISTILETAKFVAQAGGPNCEPPVNKNQRLNWVNEVTPRDVVEELLRVVALRVVIPLLSESESGIVGNSRFNRVLY
jgi:hypothetical protein